MRQKDGGPAFPRMPISGDASRYSGMSLRDYFAGQVLAGMVVGLESPSGAYIAKHCYAVADAMLKAREAK